MPNDSNENQEKTLVRYRLLDQTFNVPDDHEKVRGGDEPEYVAKDSGLIERADAAEFIDVVDWDYEREEDIKLQAPPEVVISEEGRKTALVPRRDGRDVVEIGFDQAECLQCGAVTEIVHLEDGDLKTPTKCPSCEKKTSWTLPNLPPQYSMEDVLENVPPEKVWKPPSGIEKASPSSVWDEVYDHIYSHWDVGNGEPLYEGLTAYAISTWFRDRLDFVPHLLLIGAHETGKTRLLNTLREVSYRAVNSASASPASIYRGIDQYDLTMYLSEYHDLPDEVQEQVDAVIKMGQKRGEVALRAEEVGGGGYNVTGFEPFTHAAISTQFDTRDDIRSRCFEISTQPPQRDMPRTVRDRDDLRNKLLYLRFRYLHSEEWDRARAEAEEYMDERDLFGRISEKVWPLLTVANLCDRNIEDFIDLAIEKAKEDRSQSDEAMFIQAAIDVAYKDLREGVPGTLGGDKGDIWKNLALRLRDVTEQFNTLTGRDVSAQYIGQLRNRLGLDKIRRSDGVCISDDHLHSKLKRLAEEHNVEWEPTVGIEEDVVGFESGDQAGRKAAVKRIVERISDDESGASMEEIVDAGNEEGYNPAKVKSDVERMLKTGRLYRDESDSIRPTWEN